MPQNFHLNLILLVIVHPDGNETMFSRVLLDADFGPVGQNQHPARLWERTLCQNFGIKKPGMIRVNVQVSTALLLFFNCVCRIKICCIIVAYYCTEAKAEYNDILVSFTSSLEDNMFKSVERDLTIGCIRSNVFAGKKVTEQWLLLYPGPSDYQFRIFRSAIAVTWPFLDTNSDK